MATQISKKERFFRSKISAFEHQIEASHGQLEKFRPLQLAWSFQADLIGLLERDRQRLQAKVDILEAEVTRLGGGG